MSKLGLLELSADGFRLELSFVSVVVILLVAGAVLLARYRRWGLHRYQPVEVDISLGSIGSVKFQPNDQDIQIAHKIWVELVTRKAALPFDPENDVILEVYDSWHAMFQTIRSLLGEVPGSLIRSERSTQELTRIATGTLNYGLRPHLTRWQARFRSWHEQHRSLLATKTPQELQREFPHYEQLVQELQAVSQQLAQYAAALQQIVQGKSATSSEPPWET